MKCLFIQLLLLVTLAIDEDKCRLVGGALIGDVMSVLKSNSAQIDGLICSGRMSKDRNFSWCQFNRERRRLVSESNIATSPSEVPTISLLPSANMVLT